MKSFEEIFMEAFQAGINKHGGVPVEQHLAFGNLVAIVVTGQQTGISGPSMREHWGMKIFLESHPERMGECAFNEAKGFFEQLVYGPLTSEIVAYCKDLPSYNDSELDKILRKFFRTSRKFFNRQL